MKRTLKIMVALIFLLTMALPVMAAEGFEFYPTEPISMFADSADFYPVDDVSLFRYDGFLPEGFYSCILYGEFEGSK